MGRVPHLPLQTLLAAVGERFYGSMRDDVLPRNRPSLDVFWFGNDSLEESDKLPPPEVIGAEIAEGFEAALAHSPRWRRRTARTEGSEI